MIIARCRLVVILLLVLFPFKLWAWGALGHQVVAEIAYDNLSPQAKERVDQLVTQFALKVPSVTSFQQLALYPDQLRKAGNNAYNRWHYVNQVYAVGVKAQPVVESQDAVWAISYTLSELRNNKATAFEQAFALSFLTHIVADIHQPLHCVSRYTKQYPNGDRGGLLFPIKARYADNLHQYWDQGLYFNQRYYRHYPLTTQQINHLALQLTKKYPAANFPQLHQATQTEDWLNECYTIAVRNVYRIKPNSKPSRSYQRQGQQIVEQQLSLAGYRLAQLLNQVYA